MSRTGEPFVYALSYGEQHETKIGSSYDPERRAYDIACQRGLWHSIPKVFQMWDCGRWAGSVERLCHRKLQPACTGGEWFAMPVREVCAFVDELIGALPTDKMRLVYENTRMPQAEIIRINEDIEVALRRVSDTFRTVPIPDVFKPPSERKASIG